MLMVDSYSIHMQHHRSESEPQKWRVGGENLEFSERSRYSDGMTMSGSRLYKRLSDLPTNPANPESVEEVIIAAFGAFERYYLCWKNIAGEYKQDSYGLPQALYEWLFPVTGGTRDLKTLQVVFGYEDEYFASDRNGKIENKNEGKRERIQQPETPVDKGRIQLRRRSGTVPQEMFKSLLQTETRALGSISESKQISQPVRLPRLRVRPRSGSTWGSLSLQTQNLEGRFQYSDSEDSSRSPYYRFTRPVYADAAVQTDPVPELDDSDTSSSYSTSTSSVTSPYRGDDSSLSHPLSMGNMGFYFRKPGYQLGDVLSTQYY